MRCSPKPVCDVRRVFGVEYIGSTIEKWATCMESASASVAPVRSAINHNLESARIPGQPMNPLAQVLSANNKSEIANVSQFAHTLGTNDTSMSQSGLPDEKQITTNSALPRGNSNSFNLYHGLVQICAIVCKIRFKNSS